MLKCGRPPFWKVVGVCAFNQLVVQPFILVTGWPLYNYLGVAIESLVTPILFPLVPTANWFPLPTGSLL